MTVLDRKLRREVRSALLRLLAIASIIAVGVACYVEMGSCYTNLLDARQRYYAQCRMADFSIDLKKAPLAELDAVADLPEVLELRPRIQFFATVDLPRASRLLNGQVLSLPDERTPVVNDVVLQRGSYFTAQRSNEVIVNDAFARHHAIRPGQWIHLILNDRRQEVFVVGTAISSEFVYLVGPGSLTPDPEHFGVFYLKRSYAEEVFDFQGAANQLVGRLAPAVRQRPQRVLDRAERLLAPYGVFTTTPLKDQPSNRFVSEEIEGLATFTVIMPGIFLAVAALVLNVLMSRWTEQQRTVVGTLKAIGYGDGEVLWHFVKFGLTIGLVGGVVGCALGYGLADWVTGIYRQFYEFPELVNRFYPDRMLVGLGISLVCAALGALYGAWQVLKLRPAEAMRPKPPRQGGAVLLERVGPLWRRFSFRWRLVLRDVIRNRVRTAAGLFASAMGTCILVTGFMMNQAMLRLIEFQFELVQRGDVTLGFKDERGIDALAEARRLPGVDHAEPQLDVACTFINGPHRRRGGVTGLRSDARLTVPRDKLGRRVRIPTAGLAMSRDLAELLHVKRGDWLTLRPTKGERSPRRAQVGSIVDAYIGLAVYADFEYLKPPGRGGASGLRRAIEAGRRPAAARPPGPAVEANVRRAVGNLPG